MASASSDSNKLIPPPKDCDDDEGEDDSPPYLETLAKIKSSKQFQHDVKVLHGCELEVRKFNKFQLNKIYGDLSIAKEATRMEAFAGVCNHHEDHNYAKEMEMPKSPDVLGLLRMTQNELGKFTERSNHFVQGRRAEIMDLCFQYGIIDRNDPHLEKLLEFCHLYTDHRILGMDQVEAEQEGDQEEGDSDMGQSKAEVFLKMEEHLNTTKELLSELDRLDMNKVLNGSQVNEDKSKFSLDSSAGHVAEAEATTNTTTQYN